MPSGRLLDHNAETAAFAEPLGAFLAVDDLMRRGELAQAGEVYRTVFRSCAFRFPPTRRFEHVDANDEAAMQTARASLFMDLPNQADFASAFVINSYCGDPTWTTTAPGDVAHQRTKNAVLRHSTFEPNAANIASLNHNGRASAARTGYLEARATVNANRLRARAGGSGPVSFVERCSTSGDVRQLPPLSALVPPGATVEQLRYGRLRVPRRRVDVNSVRQLRRIADVCANRIACTGR
jgi:hypothetical protein